MPSARRALGNRGFRTQIDTQISFRTGQLLGRELLRQSNPQPAAVFPVCPRPKNIRGSSGGQHAHQQVCWMMDGCRWKLIRSRAARTAIARMTQDNKKHSVSPEDELNESLK